MSSPENTALIEEARAWAKGAARVGRNIVRDVDSGILLARRLADALEAALAAASVTQPEPEYEYTSADYDGTPNNQRFYVYGSVPARIAKYRRVKAGDWEPMPNQEGDQP